MVMTLRLRMMSQILEMASAPSAAEGLCAAALQLCRGPRPVSGYAAGRAEPLAGPFWDGKCQSRPGCLPGHVATAWQCRRPAGLGLRAESDGGVSGLRGPSKS